MPTSFLLYGSYGYTGRLIVRMAAEYGLIPTLSGRNEEKLKAQSQESGFPYLVAGLDNEAALRAVVRQFSVVLHAAGPFVHTAGPMHRACLAEGVHYLDITGEITAFAAAAKLDRQAKEKNIMLMPGVGFDVVPTDCLAAYLKEQLPAADHLTLAFAWRGGGISHGTATTMLEGLGGPGAIRKDGKITPVPPAYDVRSFPFAADRQRDAVTIPWGDVFTAYHTTGIPNIKTYFATPSGQIRFMKLSRYIGPVLRLPFVKNYFKKKVDSRPAGPSDERRAKGEAYVYGEVTAPDGTTKRARLRTAEGYTLTAITALIITKKVLDGNWQAGYQTPAGAYGADLILEATGSQREDV